MDTEKTNKFLEENYDSVFVHHLSEYIKIPNLTPAFDPEYMTNGLLEQAIDYVVKFAEDLQIEGLKTHIKREEGRVPMVLFELPGASSSNVMIYGHLDKQPHMEGWIEGTGPTTPTIIGDKLYGRGSSDDGYVPFAVLLAIKNAIAQGAELPRIVLVLETEEESGSHDLVPLLEASADIIGTPDYCICLDSGALDYTSLWLTSTLRGMVAFNLKVSVTELACHSGVCGGAIPESFRIANSLLDRIEDPETRRIELLEREIPDSYKEEAKHVSSISGEDTVKAFKFLAGVKAINEDDLAELYLNTTWRPALAVTGADNLPPTSKAGNVVRDSTTLRVSIRLPPGVESTEALEKLREVITKDVPNDAKVELLEPSTGDGWQMKDLSEKTTKVLNDASDAFFTKPCGKYGIGGSIPFLKVLGDKYPSTEILALGVLGPDTNAHAPNETIDLPFTKKFLGALSHILPGLV
ncbi:unnamed protein product [Moneuplotes crassus]|uniref:Peptidase M20 dimerisation domain-containing protein n=1 Tax=Euplotes crassus TaxID=5936 RepID=A0AAD1UNS3_EUPCR|nr:unnamed protein product [Moneuplotes crassus]